ncbi:rod shape-determining protein RodA [Ectothiorhodospiraceae bacterium BW-2]|nr:rod shape-determining protein RodA [Ectothiorhodospiraceae bacterium BW-2]
MQQRSLSLQFHLDLPLLFGLLLVTAVGLITLYSAANQQPDMVVRQVVRLVVAFGVMVAVAQISPEKLLRWSMPIYYLGIVLLLGVLIMGEMGKGAQRWLDLGVFRFQPSELLKLALPMMVAAWLHDKPLPPWPKQVAIAMAIIALPAALILKQPDLGTALLVAASGLSVLFFAGLGWRYIVSTVVMLIPTAIIFWHYAMLDYQRQRVLTLINPESDPLGSGYHIIQSTIAIGSGGLFGKGWLNGTQSHLEFLPERHTDFIFAVFSEEFGFMGIALLLLLYLLIIVRGLYIAMMAQTSYGRLLASGVVMTFFVYLFVNMGMVMGLLPVVGLPLPLMSYGGSSMVTLLAGFGILMSVHTHRNLLSRT